MLKRMYRLHPQGRGYMRM